MLVNVLPFSHSFNTFTANFIASGQLGFLNLALDSSLRVYSSSSSASSSKFPPQKTNKSRLISFVTDIEGDKGYFDRFVENSSILAFEPVEPNLTPGLDFFPYEKRVTFKRDPQSENQDDSNGSTQQTTSPGHEDEVDNIHSVLVFGGDVCDKGGNDLYVIRQLLSLKKRFHSRVHFILGNRDINKMRILQELGVNPQRQGHEDEVINCPRHGGVYWFRNTGLQGDPVLIDEYFGNDQKTSGNDELENALIPEKPAERLKWILRKTMGSPDAFEFRRNELKEEKIFMAQRLGEDTESIHVSDEEVVESYRRTCHPVHGIMGQYLSQGKLCLRIGGAMFMHGSLPITPHVISRYEEIVLSKDQNDSFSKQEFWEWFFKYSTPFDENCAPKDFDEWLMELNGFAKQQHEAWKRNITLSEQSSYDQSVSLDSRNSASKVFWSTVGGYQTRDKNSDPAIEFGSLCQYGMGWLPDKSKNPTVVYNGWMMDGMPKYFNRNDEHLRSYRGIVEDFFTQVGLDVIVSGHQPVGDIPFPIRINNGLKTWGGNKFVICADTSYSGDTKWMNNAKHNRKNLGRGVAVSGRGDVTVSEIALQQDCDSLAIQAVRIRGILSDGSYYESFNDLQDKESFIGKPVDRDIFTFEGSIQDDSSDSIQWYIKSKLKDGYYLVSTGKGYDVYNSVAKVKKEYKS